jgi:hypothetical protein
LNKKSLAVVISALLLQIAAISLVIFTAGAGHGSYALARILFPFTMLSTVFGSYIGGFYVAIGLLQYLIYGLIVAVSLRANRTYKAVATIVVAHVIAIFIVFIWQNESFPN